MTQQALENEPLQDDSSATGLYVSAGRARLGVILAFLGLFLFSVGAQPDFYGWDRSPIVGFVQIEVFLTGLVLLSLGGWVGITGLWRRGTRTIPADLGLRLVGTGLIVAVFAGLADVLGMGSQPLPVPYFGPIQSAGVLAGEVIIGIGFLMAIPYRSYRN